jgi:NO-binding membrane sensor protein with MHYT domain
MIQHLSIAGSSLLLYVIIKLIKNRRLKEEYSLLWLFFGAIFLGLSIWREGLEVLSRAIGIYYAPATLFLVFIMAIFVILLHYSVVISKLTENNRKLVQEVGILAFELAELRKLHPLTSNAHDQPETDPDSFNGAG